MDNMIITRHKVEDNWSSWQTFKQMILVWLFENIPHNEYTIISHVTKITIVFYNAEDVTLFKLKFNI